MGVNKLNSLMKTMADKAGFDEKQRLTNHSARKTMVQKLNGSNIPPTHIMQLSPERQQLQYGLKRTTEKHVFDSEWKHYKYVYRKEASVDFTKWSGHRVL